MRWIDPSNAQVGHITHGADRERHVKTRHRWTTRRDLQRADSLLPARGIVIFRVESFLSSILENLDQRPGLRYRLRGLKPGRSESGRLVELLEPVAIVAEVRPAHAFEVPAGNQILDVGLLPDAETCQAHDEKSGIPRETYPTTSGLHLVAPFRITSSRPQSYCKNRAQRPGFPCGGGRLTRGQPRPLCKREPAPQTKSSSFRVWLPPFHEASNSFWTNPASYSRFCCSRT